MHSFLITGATKEKRDEWGREKMNDMGISPFDVVALTSENIRIGVADVRAFTKQLMVTPAHGNYLVGSIKEAHRLTVEAQNALLKTLEEPSPHSILLLETINAESLLPTIVSRCQVISLKTMDQYSADELVLCLETVEQLQNRKLGERIKIIDGIATDREAAKAWVEKATAASRAVILKQHAIGTAQCIRRLLKAQQQLSTNCTPKLVLDAIFLY